MGPTFKHYFWLFSLDIRYAIDISLIQNKREEPIKLIFKHSRNTNAFWLIDFLLVSEGFIRWGLHLCGCSTFVQGMPSNFVGPRIQLKAVPLNAVSSFTVLYVPPLHIVAMTRQNLNSYRALSLPKHHITFRGLKMRWILWCFGFSTSVLERNKLEDHICIVHACVF